MSTLRVNTLQNAAGTGEPSLNGTAKAWVNFNGTGTVAIRQAFNVSSITDNGVGDYTVNFTNAMPDANYCAQVTHDDNNLSSEPGWAAVRGTNTPPTTAAIRISTGKFPGSNLNDRNFVHVAIFR